MKSDFKAHLELLETLPHDMRLGLRVLDFGFRVLGFRGLGVQGFRV